MFICFLNLLLFCRCCTKSASYEYKNKSATNGAQLVPIGIPTVCWYAVHDHCVHVTTYLWTNNVGMKMMHILLISYIPKAVVGGGGGLLYTSRHKRTSMRNFGFCALVLFIWKGTGKRAYIIIWAWCIDVLGSTHTKDTRFFLLRKFCCGYIKTPYS